MTPNPEAYVRFMEMARADPLISEVRKMYDAKFRCAVLTGTTVDASCGLVAVVKVKVVCAHEHLYESFLCQAHRNMEVKGCWDCIFSKRPHIECPAKIVEPEEIEQPADIEPVVWDRERAEDLVKTTDERIRELLRAAIPEAQNTLVTDARVPSTSEAVRQWLDKYRDLKHLPVKPEETLHLDLKRPEAPDGSQ